MKVYRGKRTAQGCEVTVDGKPLGMRSDLSGNATTPFDWGYVGTGQLSVALLSDLLGSGRKAKALCGAFEEGVIAGLPRDTWTLTEYALTTALEPLVGVDGARAGDDDDDVLAVTAGAAFGDMPATDHPLPPEMIGSVDAAPTAPRISDGLGFTGFRPGATILLSTEMMDFKPVCQEVIEEVRAAHPTLTLRFEPHGDLTGEWDPARLRQVVSELLRNAVERGGISGPVDLSANSEGADVRFAVRDEGPAIPADALPVRFDSFILRRSAELPEHLPTDSTELRLLIAREVVAAHGGRIEVKSSAEVGTVFTVHLPRHRPTP